MTSKTYKELNSHLASQLVESVTEAANSRYFVFTSKHRDFTESNTPTPSASISNSVMQTYDEMLFGKQVSNSDIIQAIYKYAWANGTAYSMYDDQDTTLDSKTYYVYTEEGTDKHVWKCIDNNSNATSNSKPLYSDVTGSLDSLYIKSAADGYQWRYMYTIPEATWDKFNANNFIPVVANTNAETNAINGAIDMIKVTNNGNNYNEYVSGSVSSATNTTVFVITGSNISGNNDFYNNCMIYITGGTGSGEFKQITDYVGSTKTVTVNTAFNSALDSTSTLQIQPYVRIRGDGSNAEARAIINTSTNTISNVEILQRGSGYTYADITIEANNMAAANLAVARAIMGPFGGHGSNPKEELNAQYVIISTDFANNESSNIPTHNDFRTVGLLKDPYWANLQVTISSPTTNFTVGETVTTTDGSTGYVQFANSSAIRVSNGIGAFANSGSISGGTSSANADISGISINAEDSRSNSSYFEQTFKFTTNLVSGNPFSEDEKVTINNANGFVYFSNSTETSLTTVRGTFDTSNTDTVTGASSSETAKFSGKISPDLVRGSGKVLMLKNVAAVSRSNTTTETVKLVIKF